MHYLFWCYCCHLLTSFQKILSGTLSECQSFWIQIRTEVVVGLDLVPNCLQGHHQTTIVSASMERVIAPITTAADDKFYEIFYFMENRAGHLCELSVSRQFS